MIQSPESIAFCVKGMRALWEYYPDEIEAATETALSSDTQTDEALQQ
jgi:hypothetical protein